MTHLTQAENAAAILQAIGLTEKEIAERLKKKVGTVKTQLVSARRKTGTRNKEELARVLWQVNQEHGMNAIRGDEARNSSPSIFPPTQI